MIPPAARATPPPRRSTSSRPTQLDTALGVRGRESGKGTVKITHAKPDGADANASALSIALEGAGTAAQGIYIGNDAGNPTTGDLLHIRNGGPGTDRLRLTADGHLETARGVTVNAMVTTADALDAATRAIYSSFQHQLRLQPIPAGGTGQITSVFGFYAPPTTSVDAGWSVNNYAMLRIEAPQGSGPILNLTGIDIRDFRGRAALNYSMRSFGPAVHMRHSGGINVGSQATPDTALHVRGNPSYHGSVTLDQESADPAPPAARQRARLYVKDGKLVVQWNDGGKTLFTAIPLEASGPYPVTVPVTTDTTPP